MKGRTVADLLGILLVLLFFTKTFAEELKVSHGYRYVGCYKNGGSNELNKTMARFSSPAMTIDLCLERCHSEGYQFSAVQDGDECQCLSTPDPMLMVEMDDCMIHCSGDSRELCGGNNRKSIYEKSSSIAVLTGISYEYIGCYQDNKDLPVLNKYQADFSQVMTLDLCIMVCYNSGSLYAGMQSGHLCYCGHCCYNHEGSKLPEDRCDSPCDGNHNQACGGVTLNSVYRINYNCSSPPVVENAELLSHQSSNDSVAIYRCKNGYHKTGGEEVMSCITDNKGDPDWEDSSPLQCTKYTSPDSTPADYLVGILIGMGVVICVAVVVLFLLVWKKRRDSAPSQPQLDQERLNVPTDDSLPVPVTEDGNDVTATPTSDSREENQPLINLNAERNQYGAAAAVNIIN